MSFQDLKKSRSGFDTLQKSLETSGGNNTQKSFADDRIYLEKYLSRDLVNPV